MTDPAAPVRLTLRRDEADWIRANLAAEIENDASPLPSRWRPFLRDALDYALAAPEPPADDLAALIAECEAQGWRWTLARRDADDDPYYACVIPPGPFDATNYPAWAETPALAFRAAMDAARQAAGEENS